MKKLIFLLTLGLMLSRLYGQDQGRYLLLEQGQGHGAMIDGPAGSFACTAGAFYGQDPDLSNAMTSDTLIDTRSYDDFSGIAGNILSIHWWGLMAIDGIIDWDPCNENPKSFRISFYENNAGTPGTEVYTFTVSVKGVETGYNIGSSFPVLFYAAKLPVPLSGLSDGWLSIEGYPAGSCIFFWQLSPDGNGSCYHNLMGPAPFDLAYCIYTDTYPAPLGDWAIYTGVFLIAVFLLFRLWRRFV